MNDNNESTKNQPAKKPVCLCGTCGGDITKAPPGKLEQYYFGLIKPLLEAERAKMAQMSSGDAPGAQGDGKGKRKDG